MPLQITGRHHDVTETEKAYIEKKVRRIEKHFDRIQEIAFILEAAKVESHVEINFRAGTISAHVKATGETMTAAIDLAMDKLEAQAGKVKDKMKDHKHGPDVPPPAEETADED